MQYKIIKTDQLYLQKQLTDDGIVLEIVVRQLVHYNDELTQKNTYILKREEDAKKL